MHKDSYWLLIAGILFVLAGIRDWVAPGFLCISGPTHGDIGLNLTVGTVFVVAALRKNYQQKPS